MIVADTSVIVAAIAEWHTMHERADAALPNVAVAHTLLEAYAVLTRLPEPQRATPVVVAEVLKSRFRRTIALGTKASLALPSTLARLGISGGASYDALIALTAHANGATLISLDERAIRTYRLCGVTAELLT